MQRRRFLGTTLLAAAALPVGASVAAAQRRGGRTPSLRADWRPDGPRTGRTPRDATALDGDERAHVPVLTLPPRIQLGRAFDLVVQIGLEPHPMTSEHRIDWIEVSLGDARVLTADLGPGVPWPIVRVPLVVGAPASLVVRARCSQHGVWMTARDVG